MWDREGVSRVRSWIWAWKKALEVEFDGATEALAFVPMTRSARLSNLRSQNPIDRHLRRYECPDTAVLARLLYRTTEQYRCWHSTVHRVCMYVGRRKGEGMRGDNTTIGPSHGNLRPDGRRSWHALPPDIFSRPCKTITREQTRLVSHLSPSRIGPCCDLFVHRMEKRGERFQAQSWAGCAALCNAREGSRTPTRDFGAR